MAQRQLRRSPSVTHFVVREGDRRNKRTNTNRIDAGNEYIRITGEAIGLIGRLVIVTGHFEADGTSVGTSKLVIYVIICAVYFGSTYRAQTSKCAFCASVCVLRKINFGSDPLLK